MTPQCIWGVLGVLAPAFVCAQPVPPANPWNHERAAAIVYIALDNAVGTGVMVKAKAAYHILTASHVLFPGIDTNAPVNLGAQCDVAIPAGLKLSLGGRSGRNDLSALCVRHLGKDASLIQLSNPAVGSPNYPSVKLFSRKVDEGEYLYLAGFLLGNDLTKVAGQVRVPAAQKDSVLIDFRAGQGFSGGPYATAEGHVIGIHRASIATYPAMTPIYMIRAGLLNAGIDVLEMPPLHPQIDLPAPSVPSARLPPRAPVQPKLRSLAYIALDKSRVTNDKHLDLLKDVMSEVADQISRTTEQTAVAILDEWIPQDWERNPPEKFSHFLVAIPRTLPSKKTTRVEFEVGKFRNRRLVELGRLNSLEYEISTDAEDSNRLVLRPRKESTQLSVQDAASAVATHVRQELFPELSGEWRYSVGCFKDDLGEYSDVLRTPPYRIASTLAERLAAEGSRGLRKSVHATSMSDEEWARSYCRNRVMANEGWVHVVINGRVERLKEGVVRVPIDVDHFILRNRWNTKALAESRGSEVHERVAENQRIDESMKEEGVPFARRPSFNFCLGLQAHPGATLPMLLDFVRSEAEAKLEFPWDCNAHK